MIAAAGLFAKTHWRWLAAGAGLIALLLAAAGLVIAVRGMIGDARDSGLKQGRAEVQARWNAEVAGRALARAELSTVLAEAFNGLDGSLQRTLTKVSSDGQTIRVHLEKEMAHDPRYSSADCSLGDGVRDQINAARRLSGPAAAATVHSGGVPSSGAAVRLDIGGAGQR